jgi:hypothetical protein
MERKSSPSLTGGPPERTKRLTVTNLLCEKDLDEVQPRCNLPIFRWIFRVWEISENISLRNFRDKSGRMMSLKMKRGCSAERRRAMEVRRCWSRSCCALVCLDGLMDPSMGILGFLEHERGLAGTTGREKGAMSVIS